MESDLEIADDQGGLVVDITLDLVLVFFGFNVHISSSVRHISCKKIHASLGDSVEIHLSVVSLSVPAIPILIL